jgi:tellurite resistance protein
MASGAVPMSTFSAHDSLVATMIVMAAADSTMTESETETVTAIVGLLPVFRGFAPQRIAEISAIVVQMLQEENGIDQIMALVEEGLPGRLAETAYALACDVAAADGGLSYEEIQLLEIIRHRLGLDRLNAAAIERGARARHATLDDA